MTKIMSVFCLIILASCASHRGPASIDGHPVAYDSTALGNVKAQALKRTANQQVCFDISLEAKNVQREHLQASNWTLAWVDSKDQYHLLSVKQREPASTPKGGVVVAPYGYYQEYTNSFTTCIPKARSADVKSLVLTPKELPYSKKDGLHLTWNK